MRRQKFGIILLVPMSGVLLAAAPRIRAQETERADIPLMMEEKRCVLCHDQTERRVGPPYEMIASLYADSDKEVIDKLARKITEGGGGTWGAMPMPANSHVTEAEARAMARWILDLE